MMWLFFCYFLVYFFFFFLVQFFLVFFRCTFLDVCGFFVSFGVFVLGFVRFGKVLLRFLGVWEDFGSIFCHNKPNRGEWYCFVGSSPCSAVAVAKYGVGVWSKASVEKHSRGYTLCVFIDENMQ
jgi:hypothetical protein